MRTPTDKEERVTEDLRAGRRVEARHRLVAPVAIDLSCEAPERVREMEAEIAEAFADLDRSRAAASS